ncbi:MAG: hypothetical protein KDH94_02755 [Coxiellaceae bacterium]|nr:hypothetical protein [Coxiellaceae bacterium]
MPKKTGDKGDASTSKAKEEKVASDVVSELKEKIPNLSEISKKIDLDGILGSIKSMISPDEAAAKVDPKDALGMKVTQLSALLKEISKSHAQLAKDFSKANDILSGLFKDVEAVRSGKKTNSK